MIVLICLIILLLSLTGRVDSEKSFWLLCWSILAGLTESFIWAITIYNMSL